ENNQLNDNDLDQVHGGGDDSPLRSQALEAGNLINELRENAGLNDLDWNMNLEQVSEVRAEEAHDVFTHTRPDGQAWNKATSPVQGGENLAFGFDNADDVVDGWMDSPTHRDNIHYSDFEKGAIAIYQDNDDTLYWSHQFGY
ncbi:MAG: CAP domain-containing protein, partial [Butyrivibrio sp.]|nr:CAP domain-containing protein [Butyrivibrio sp.]